MMTRPFYYCQKQTSTRAFRVAGLCLLASTKALSVEVLQGPVLGETIWTTNSEQSPKDSVVVKEHFANIDVPIPLALPMGMPFATIRYRDTTGFPNHRFTADQRVGLGLLHHSAEGDPAWRVDVSRSGLWAVQGTLWARAIVNLAKPYPWLKLRPSDSVYSWFGLHSISAVHKKTRWIPEFAWIRKDNSGLLLDFVAPEHLFLGYQGPVFGLVLGPEQNLHHWTTTGTTEKNDSWTIHQQLRAKASFRPFPSLICSASALREISQTLDIPATGAEVSIQWIPNP